MVTLDSLYKLATHSKRYFWQQGLDERKLYLRGSSFHELFAGKRLTAAVEMEEEASLV